MKKFSVRYTEHICMILQSQNGHWVHPLIIFISLHLPQEEQYFVHLEDLFQFGSAIEDPL